MSIFYVLYFILSPLIFIILIIFSLFNKKVYEHLINQRKTFKEAIKKNLKDPIIIHAASAGEFEQIKPLLKDKKINKPIIQTFFSPTIYNKEKESKLFDICCYHPFDFPWSAYIFFKKLAPKKYIINRHDIWPHHIIFAKLFNIEVIYINANLKSDSLRLKFPFKYFNKWLFKKINLIVAPSIEIQNRFTKHFETENILTYQDTRFIQIQNRINENKEIQFVGEFPYEKTIILGSIDHNDWDIIYEALKKTNELNLHLIIVPHEVDNNFIDKIKQDIKELNMSVKSFTDMNKNSNPSCIIYDKVGDLLDIYKYGRLAYIGCGFSDGVHNILEPALQGCYVAYGPNISLLDEAIKLDHSNLGVMIQNSCDMSNFLQTADIDFLNKTKSDVLDLFKIKDEDYQKIKDVIYEN
tara:strand:+ start:1361 stop:2590 length:1230 start_codon:yes stop_codon:yes gene_type:complete